MVQWFIRIINYDPPTTPIRRETSKIVRVVHNKQISKKEYIRHHNHFMKLISRELGVMLLDRDLITINVRDLNSKMGYPGNDIVEINMELKIINYEK